MYSKMVPSSCSWTMWSSKTLSYKVLGFLSGAGMLGDKPGQDLDAIGSGNGRGNRNRDHWGKKEEEKEERRMERRRCPGQKVACLEMIY